MMAALSTEFPQDAGLCYLNHAGVAPWPRRTAEAVQRFAAENVSQGAEHYPDWLVVESRLRERLARLVDADSSDDVALVKNTSEGLSLIAYGLDWRAGDNVVINREEFPSNRVVWESLTARFGVEVRDVPLGPPGDPEAPLIEAVDARTRLLPVSAVQYGTGLRMDLDRLGEAARRVGALFCVDAIQLLGARPFSAPALGADFAVADGHKWMLGPEGLGVLYVRPGLRESLRLNQFGWHMVEAMGDYDRKDWEPAATARRFEPGSPNSLAVHALEASLSLLEDVGMAEVERRLLDITDALQARIEREPDLELVTPRSRDRRAGIVTFAVAGADPARLRRALRRERVICAARGGGIRFAPHFYQAPGTVEAAVERLLGLLARGVD